MQVTAALYARISDADDELGVTDQLAWCRTEAARRGWTVAAEFFDNDISASKFSRKARPDYEALKRALAAGEVNAVVCTEMSRLHRRPVEWFSYKESNPKLKIHTRDLAIDLETGQGAQAADWAAVNDAHESERTSKRVKAKTASAARKGLPPTGGTRRYGYTRDFEVITDEADVIRAMAAGILRGDSIRAVAAKAGLPRQKAQRVLSSPLIAGYRNHPDVGEVVGKWPAILDKSEWDRVQRVISGRLAPSGKPARVALLMGRAVCGHCGARLHSSSVGTRRKGEYTRVYACKPNHSARTGCYKTMRTAEKVEAVVVEALLFRLESEDFARTVEALTDVETRTAELHAEVTRLKQKAADAKDDFKADRIERADWLDIAADCRGKAARLTAELAELEGGRALAAVSTEDVRGMWDAASLDWKRALLADVVDHVVLLPVDRLAGRRFDAGAVKIEWKL